MADIDEAIALLQGVDYQAPSSEWTCRRGDYQGDGIERDVYEHPSGACVESSVVAHHPDEFFVRHPRMRAGEEWHGSLGEAMDAARNAMVRLPWGFEPVPTGLGTSYPAGGNVWLWCSQPLTSIPRDRRVIELPGGAYYWNDGAGDHGQCADRREAFTRALGYGAGVSPEDALRHHESRRPP